MVSSPSGEPRAYICIECATIASAIVNDKEDPFAGNPLLEEFLNAAERWSGDESDEHLSEMRRIAALLFSRTSPQ